MYNLVFYIILLFLLFFDIFVFYKNKKLFFRKISKKNIMLFHMLRKSYLSSVNDDDIKDLISYCYLYLQERKNKYENKK